MRKSKKYRKIAFCCDEKIDCHTFDPRHLKLPKPCNPQSFLVHQNDLWETVGGSLYYDSAVIEVWAIVPYKLLNRAKFSKKFRVRKKYVTRISKWLYPAEIGRKEDAIW